MNKKLFLLCFCLFVVSECSCQEEILKRGRQWGYQCNQTPNYTFISNLSSHCKEKVWDCALSDMGKSTGIWLSKDGQCEVGVFIRKWDESGLPPSRKGVFHQYAWNRIRSGLHWGRLLVPCPNSSHDDIMMLLTEYPKKLAKKYFNSDRMYVYPINMNGKKCRDKYSVLMAVYLHVDYRVACPHLLFAMTDESAENFDKYLEEFQKTIWVDRKWKK